MFYIILLLIFCRPFISSLSFPVLNSAYSAVFLFFLAIWVIVKRRAMRENFPIKLELPLMLFILSLAASTLLSQNRIHSFREFPRYLSGLLLFMIPSSLSPENKKRVLFTILLAGVSISFLAIYQHFFGFEYILNYLAKEKTPPTGLIGYLSQRRAFLPFISPNTLAGYLVMIIPLSLAFKKGFFFTLPLGIALLFTKSLGALLSLLLGIMLYFYLKNQKGGRKIVMRQRTGAPSFHALDRRDILVPPTSEAGLENPAYPGFRNNFSLLNDVLRKITLFCALSAVIFLVFLLRQNSGSQFNQPGFSLLRRWDYWKETLGIIKLFPFLGVGLGNLDLSQARYAHNGYLQIWAETGIFGIIAFLWLIGSACATTAKTYQEISYKKENAGVLTGVITLLIYNLIDFAFLLPEVNFTWWLLAGCVLSASQSNNPDLR